MYHSINSTQNCVNPIGPSEEMFRLFISADHACVCVCVCVCVCGVVGSGQVECMQHDSQ
jgi:hypothetical protein